VVYVASDRLYAYDAAGSIGCSGTPKTCTPLLGAPLPIRTLSSPTVANGRVYVGALDNHLHAFALP
jgi:outer membrane protein assembly factor BamB